MSPISRHRYLDPISEDGKSTSSAFELDPVEMESLTISKQITPEQRYWYYVERGFSNNDLAKLEKSAMQRIKNLVNPKLLSSRAYSVNSSALNEQINSMYATAIKQGIVDYILLDKSEQERLMIPPFIDRYSLTLCRAPVPWHDSLLHCKTELIHQLHITNPMMTKILAAFQSFKETKIVDTSVFVPSSLPVTLEDFQSILKSQCQAFKTKMITE